jgi:protein involved in polysaccharide export with SLBB domain
VSFRPASSSTTQRKPLFAFLNRSKPEETPPPPMVQMGTPCSRCTPVVASANCERCGTGAAMMLRPVPAGTAAAGGLAASAWAPVQRVSADGTAGTEQPSGAGYVALDRPQPVNLAPTMAAPPLTAPPTDPSLLPHPVPADLPVAAPPVKAKAGANGKGVVVPWNHKPPPGYPELPPALVPHPPEAPREFDKRALAAYIIEPPDILIIQATSAISLPNQPITGTHLVRPDGNISLGAYGEVFVAGRTIEGARRAVAELLLNLKKSGFLTREDIIDIQGEEKILRLFDPDMKLTTDLQKRAFLLNLTRERLLSRFTADQIRDMEAQLRKRLERLTLDDILKELNLDVAAFNSKFYYVITDGGGYGATVLRFPYTGNETVLDGLSQIAGLPVVASKKRVWVARATPFDHNPTILPVDWRGIAQRGSAATNYQLFPGDRIYVDSDRLIKTDSFLAKVISPIERLLGVTLLGSTTVNSIRNGR